jgi:hypothetical protein
LRKDFVVKGAPLRGELKAAGIVPRELSNARRAHQTV